MTPGKVLINMPSEFSNLDPRVWAKLRDEADIDTTSVGCPFQEGDILDCRPANWHSSTSASTAKPAAAVVLSVDSDGTVEIGYFDGDGDYVAGDYIFWEHCTLIHRLGDPMPAPRQDTRTEGGTATTYDYTKNPDWNPG